MASGWVEQLTGRTQSHLVELDDRLKIHREAKADFLSLQSLAKKAGFELAVASSFRSFERQCIIWQDKLAGRRPILSDSGDALDVDALSEEETLWALLRWSALPGTSRHHWGTDLDIFDRAALPDGYRLQLVPEEYEAGGVLADFNHWLAELIDRDQACGFFRPYSSDIGSVAPEPWHISYRPMANEYVSRFDRAVFESLLESGCWPLENAIRRNSQQIYQRFVLLQDDKAAFKKEIGNGQDT